MKSSPKHIVKQNLLFPIGLLVFVSAIIFGFIIFTYELEVPLVIKFIFIGIPLVVFVFHFLQRMFSWELILYENIIEISKPFGLDKNSRRKINYGEIREVDFLQGRKLLTSMKINTNSGKKYNVLLDNNFIEISKMLFFLENSGVTVKLNCDNRIKRKLKKLREKNV
ncbi:hypothetical protein D9V96_017925 [Zobellia laminariae]|uniref:hypothetical protein n=1 Tax=Zobellia laminariae TaxID=248906 RepID=UPI0012D8AF07|nr:hypothetical protein [Zobellia laminariae]